MEKVKFTAKVMGLLLLVPALFLGMLLRQPDASLPENGTQPSLSQPAATASMPLSHAG